MSSDLTNASTVEESNVKVVRTETNEYGESIQTVRPYSLSTKTTEEIVGNLVNKFQYKTKSVNASEHELNAVQQAFGSSLADELIKTYDGSHLVSDSQQDLIGERYLAEQIKLIEEQQKNSSVLNKWGHLLYEGDGPKLKSGSNVLTTVTEVTSQNTSTVQRAPSVSQTVLSNQNTIETQATNIDNGKSDESILNEIIGQVKREQDRLYREQALKEEMDKIRSDIDAQSSERTYEEQTRAHVEARLQAAKAFIEEEERQSELSKNSEIKPNAHKFEPQLPTSRSFAEAASSPSYVSSSHLKSVTLESYNTPEFKAMLDHILKPVTIPIEHTNMPPDWPSPEKIASLAQPIYIPAPLPIVIPAPNMQFEKDMKNWPENAIKPIITHFPKPVQSIASDQLKFQDFGIRQLDANHGI